MLEILSDVFLIYEEVISQTDKEVTTKEVGGTGNGKTPKESYEGIVGKSNPASKTSGIQLAYIIRE